MTLQVFKLNLQEPTIAQSAKGENSFFVHGMFFQEHCVQLVS